MQREESLLVSGGLLSDTAEGQRSIHRPASAGATMDKNVNVPFTKWSTSTLVYLLEIVFYIIRHFADTFV